MSKINSVILGILSGFFLFNLDLSFFSEFNPLTILYMMVLINGYIAIDKHIKSLPNIPENVGLFTLGFTFGFGLSKFLEVTGFKTI